MAHSRHVSRRLLTGMAGVGLAITALAPGAAAQSSPAPAATTPYVPLTAAPCDVSGKNIHFLSVLKGHPTLRLWQQGFIDQAAALGFKSATIASPDEADWSKAVGLGEGILATGTDGMVFGFVDPIEADLIKKFGDKGIPVVIGHVVVPEGTYRGPHRLEWLRACEVGCRGSRCHRRQDRWHRHRGHHRRLVQRGRGCRGQGASRTSSPRSTRASRSSRPQEEGFDPPVAIAKAVAILQANPDVVGAMSTTGAGPRHLGRRGR